MEKPEDQSNFDYKEIYQQRYETYRHFDGLRWQMMQIGIAAASAVFAFSSGGGLKPQWWTWMGVGVVLIFSGTAMLRIGSGISANSDMLGKAARQLGDDQVPGNSNLRSSVAFWIAASMVLTGAISILYPLIIKICS